MENEDKKHFPNKRIRKKSRRKWYYTVSTTMAAVVVFCTVYALILPAITLEKKQNDVAPAADTSNVASWGYDDDGSAWWETAASLTQITAVQENTPYIIMGFQGNNLMGDEIFEREGSSYLKAIPKENATDYTSYQRWYFERAEGDKCYYIYYLAADNSTKQYLRFVGDGVEEWGKIPQQIALSDEKAQASVFTVERVGDISPLPSDAARVPDHIAISVVVDGVSYYINSYYGDKPASDNLTTHWWGYPEISGGSALKIC